MNHLWNFLAGMGSALALAPDREYIRPQGGFRRDARRLQADSQRVARDLTQGVKRHGPQIDHRSR